MWKSEMHGNVVILYIILCHVLTLPISLPWLPEVTAENEDEANLFGCKNSKADTST